MVGDFTGEDVRKVHHDSRSGRSSDALRRLNLQQSKESLEDLELFLRGATDDYEEVFSMVTAYPNLKNLEFFQTEDDDDIVELDARERRFEVPKGARSVSKLESVEITLNEGQISLNDGFWKWIGGNGTLHTLVLKQLFRISTSIDFQSFQSLLFISGSSLTALSLSGLYLPLGIVKEQLRFSTLRSLYLKGNSQLVNVVMKAEFSCLETLTLACEGSQSSWIDHDGIAKALGTCRDTIENISIQVVQSSQEAGFSLMTESSNFERMEVSDRSNALFLPKVRYLNLQVDDATISRLYLPIDYLEFSLVELPSSSRFSESSFFQRGTSQSPVGSGK